MANGRWQAALRCCAVALADNPAAAGWWGRVAEIRLQLNDRPEAESALRQAAAVDPDDFAPMAHFLAARDLAADGEPRRWLALLAERAATHFPDVIRVLNDCSGAASRRLLRGTTSACAAQLAADAPATPRLALDVTELMQWFQAFRLPSGVQRVQIGIVAALLDDPAADVLLTRFDGAAWRPVPADAFREILRLSQVSDDTGDPVWREAVVDVSIQLAGAPLVEFDRTTTLLSLGAWVTDAFLDAFDRIKRASGARYVPLIYDLIPVRHPEWFNPAVGRNMARWIKRLPQTADGFVTISQSTKRDVIAVLADNGRSVDPDTITVMPLDAESGVAGPSEATAAARTLARFALEPRGYVLFVSTIEPRKNHLTAFRAWRSLLAGQAAADVLPLVCVGGRGWGNAAVHRMLRDPVLRPHVRLLTGVADDDLAVLYANARFTLYPSLYEGWGLPVTESLAHGVPALVADNSSLREAGGALVDYFVTEDATDLADQAARLLTDDDYLAARRGAVQAGFRARSWRALAADLERGAARASRHAGLPGLPAR